MFNSTVNVSFSQRFECEQDEKLSRICPNNAAEARETLDTLLPCPPRSSYSQAGSLSRNWSHYGSRIQPAQRYVEGRKALASCAGTLRCRSGLPARCPAFLRLRSIASARSGNRSLRRRRDQCRVFCEHSFRVAWLRSFPLRHALA